MLELDHDNAALVRRGVTVAGKGGRPLLGDLQLGCRHRRAQELHADKF